MLARNRSIAVLACIGYLLVTFGSALFHNHSLCRCHCGESECGERGFSSGISISETSDEHECDAHDCSICQYLAQKTAPAHVVAPVFSSTLIQAVIIVSSSLASGVSFTAWHSRAPPVLA